MVVELLGLGIRQNQTLQGIKLENTDVEIRSGQFADDIWTMLLATQVNMNEILAELEQFSELTGLRINSEKCAVL